MILLSLSIHPPLLVEGHGGGRCYAMREVGGRYCEEERVFGGIDEPEGTAFSPGPAMRYAKVDARRVRAFHAGHRLETWRLADARIVAWWSLPVVVRGGRVDALQPHGRVKRLHLDGRDLKTVLPGRSGALFALYSTKSHWRVLRRVHGGDRGTPWIPGSASDFAPSPDRIFVAVGNPGGAYKDYGANGPGALWAYTFRSGDLVRLKTYGERTQIVFDDPWVHPGHVASLLDWPRETNVASSWYPYRTRLLLLDDPRAPLRTLASGWEVHAFDAPSGEFLGLHINRKNMGYDLRRVSITTGAQKDVAEDIDALDVSTGSPYLPAVKDGIKVLSTTSGRSCMIEPHFARPSANCPDCRSAKASFPSDFERRVSTLAFRPLVRL